MRQRPENPGVGLKKVIITVRPAAYIRFCALPQNLYRCKPPVYHAYMNEPGVVPDGPVYTPSELNREVRLHLEAGFPQILLEAEISNLSRPASGHLYFSLKDESAQIKSAMFRSAVQRTSLRIENGMKVLSLIHI